jgi:hypothetical protein
MQLQLPLAQRSYVPTGQTAEQQQQRPHCFNMNFTGMTVSKLAIDFLKQHPKASVKLR